MFVAAACSIILLVDAKHLLQVASGINRNTNPPPSDIRKVGHTSVTFVKLDF